MAPACASPVLAAMTASPRFRPSPNDFRASRADYPPSTHESRRRGRSGGAEGLDPGAAYGHGQQVDDQAGPLVLGKLLMEVRRQGSGGQEGHRAALGHLEELVGRPLDR